MNYTSTSGIVLNRAARRRKTVLSIKNKGGVGGSHNSIALATVLRMSGAGAFTTVRSRSRLSVHRVKPARARQPVTTTSQTRRISVR